MFDNCCTCHTAEQAYCDQCCDCVTPETKALESKLSAAREALAQIVKLGEGPLKNCMTQESYLAAEALKVIGEEAK